MKHPTSLSTTFGALPIFGCGALIVGAWAADAFPSIERMLGRDARSLRRSMSASGKPAAMVPAQEPGVQYDHLIGIADGNLEFLPAALELAENAGCRCITVVACGVYELTAEAARLDAAAAQDAALAETAHRLYEQAVQNAPRTTAELHRQLLPFIEQIGHVQFVDVVTSITSTNEISPVFADLEIS